MSEHDPDDRPPEFRAGLFSLWPLRLKPMAKTVGLWVFLTVMFWALWWFFQQR